MCQRQVISKLVSDSKAHRGGALSPGESIEGDTLETGGRGAPPGTPGPRRGGSEGDQPCEGLERRESQAEGRACTKARDRLARGVSAEQKGQGTGNATETVMHREKGVPLLWLLLLQRENTPYSHGLPGQESVQTGRADDQSPFSTAGLLRSLNSNAHAGFPEGTNACMHNFPSSERLFPWHGSWD